MNTSASWRFQLFNFPIRVHFSFFLIAILLGFQYNNLILIALWALIVFVSVLLHELGHAFVSDYYGRAPQIELYSMGGLTVSTRYSMLSYPKEIFISFAGPLAGFLFGGAILLLNNLIGPSSNFYLNFIISSLLWVNIGWGIINLIPILPLDGGNIMRALYHWLRSPYDERTPLKISIGFGVLSIIALLVIFGRGGIYMAFLAAYLTLNNYQALRNGYWTDKII